MLKSWLFSTVHTRLQPAARAKRLLEQPEHTGPLPDIGFGPGRELKVLLRLNYGSGSKAYKARARMVLAKTGIKLLPQHMPLSLYRIILSN